MGWEQNGKEGPQSAKVRQKRDRSPAVSAGIMSPHFPDSFLHSLMSPTGSLPVPLVCTALPSYL